MKNLFTLFVMSLLIGLPHLNAQIYVHAGANGANDGNSWADAYSDLSTAISNAPLNAEIWVAAGTYVPNTPAGRSATFRINKNLKLYGGFAGTETQLSERNPNVHISLLSGDVNGDDTISNDSLLNRSDNVYNIMKISGVPDSTAILDGFTFTRGHADGPGLDDTRGGAINTRGDMRIRNCVFTENYCEDRGGAFFAFGTLARGLRVSQCTFEKNRCNASGGALYIWTVPKFQVDSCDFIENKAFQDSIGALGAAAYVYNSSGTFLGNLFSKNVALRTGGGLVLSLNSRSTSHILTVSQCTFSENQASYGGGMYVFANGDNDHILVDSCEFTGNISSDLLLGFSFGSGGAIGLTHSADRDATDNSIRIENCLLKQNRTTYAGGGINCYNYDGQGNSLDIVNCEFLENYAAYGGGALFVNTPNDDHTISVSKSHFEKNSGLNGMAVGLTRGNAMTISPSQQCTFRNCLFTENEAPEIDGVVLGVYYGRMDIINTTIINNKSNAISALTSGEFNLQNNILYNPGYAEYAGVDVFNPIDVSITSVGGNLVRDTSLNAWLMPNKDLSNAIPLFEAGTYIPAFNSPSVDMGYFYTGFLPTDVDAAGNARWQGKNIDAGAYESPYTTAIKDLLISDQVLSLFPNPVSSHTTLELDNVWRGQLSMRIFNLQGQLVYDQKLSKHDQQGRWTFDLGQLATGTYHLVLTDGNQHVSKAFVKVGH